MNPNTPPTSHPDRNYARMVMATGTLTIALKHIPVCPFVEDLQWALERIDGRGQQSQLKRHHIELRIADLKRQAA